MKESKERKSANHLPVREEEKRKNLLKAKNLGDTATPAYSALF